MNDGPLRVAQIGNFEPPHSTENELRKALLALGHGVDSYQEGHRGDWLRLSENVRKGAHPDLILWTRTASELERIPLQLQQEVITRARRLGVPVVGYHLDIWHSLPRAHELPSVPYFTLVDVMCTADGGHQDEWAELGVDHRWFPPGVSEFECARGEQQDRFSARVGFVGNWTTGYHPEAKHRYELVRWLQDRDDVEVRFWPEPGHHAVRGDDLRHLYASVDVVVGDSCNVDGAGYYCSDRIPETLGRGGFLLHPRTEGVTDGFAWWAWEDVLGAPMWKDGEHLACWEPGRWDMLGDLLENALADDRGRSVISEEGRLHTLTFHTYRHRMDVLVRMLRAEGRLP